MSLGRVWAAVLGAALLVSSACVESEPQLVAEVVPAGEPEYDDGNNPIVARYWGEIDPSVGRMDIFPLHEGNVIYRGEMLTIGTNYNYNQTANQDNSACTTPPCLPAANLVRLFTDQNQVTFVNGAGTQCTSNGTSFSDDNCGGKIPVGDVCRGPNRFCGPIAMFSGFLFGGFVGAMPNVVLQITPGGGSANTILGCNDNPSGSAGLCAATNPLKVDNMATSNLVSPIPGDGGGVNRGCSWCYGNQTAAGAARAGLQHAVVSDVASDGISAGLQAINTDKLVLQLQNSGGINVVITVRYATPVLDASPATQVTYSNGGTPATCVTRGTTAVSINGGSFGPPGACLSTTQPPASCPLAGAPAATYRVVVPGFATPVAPASWSDTTLQFSAAGGPFTECPMTVQTPVGNTAATQSVAICDNQWRTWTPTLAGAALNRVNPVAGVLTAGGQRFIVLHGGRTSVTTLNSTPPAAQRTLAMPVPSCTNPNPNWAQVTFTGTQTNRYNSAATVSNNFLYVLGGTSNGSNCTRVFRRFQLLTATTGAWVQLTSIPDMSTASGNQGLCNGTLTPVRDAAGKEWLVLTGGSTVPVPNTACNGGTSPNPLRTLIYDPAANTWTSVTGVPSVDNDGVNPLFRFGTAAGSDGAATSSASLLVGGSSSTTQPGTVLTRAVRITVATVMGVPGATFADETMTAGLPAGVFGPAGVVANGSLYLTGGASALSPGSCNGSNHGQLPAVASVRRIDTGFLGPWVDVANLPEARAEHAIVAADTTGAGEAKLYVIGGQSASAPVVTIAEYTP